jgi:hypothetical protein
MVATGHFIGKKNKLHAHGGDAPGDTEVWVHCQDRPKMVRPIRGQWWLAMGAREDKEAVKDKTVVVSVHTNITAWTGEAFNFTLDTPAPLQSVTSNIVQALRESESRLPVTMLVAIGVTSFLIITYVKFNK